MQNFIQYLIHYLRKHSRFLFVKSCLIILKMDNLRNPQTIQARLTKCTFKSVANPTFFSFKLSHCNNYSDFSPWCPSDIGVIPLNYFLRLTDQFEEVTPGCFLQLYFKAAEKNNIAGRTFIKLKWHEDQKVRKYTIKDNNLDIATVSLSIFIKKNDNNQPICRTPSSEISVKTNFSSINQNDYYSCDMGSILSHLKLDLESQSIKNTFLHPQNSKLFSMNNNVETMAKRQEFDRLDAQNLLLQFFEKIEKKQVQIDKKQAILCQKQAEIQHIKLKQKILKHDQKKVRRLKSRTEFLIAANSVLLGKDQFYDQEFLKLKKQNKQMEQTIVKIASQSSVKLISLKKQLQNAKHNLQLRDKKVSMLYQQTHQYVRQLNVAKNVIHQKSNIIKNLKAELAYIQEEEQKQQSFNKNKSTKAQTPSLTSKYSQEGLNKVKNQHPKSNNNFVHNQQNKIRKCKTLSLFKPKSQISGNKYSPTKTKGGIIQQSKSQQCLKLLRKQSMKLPNLVAYLMSMHQSNMISI